jgi:dehydrogenase/reductase SDR family protein 12
MKTRDLMKIINFYARFTPSYTKIGYYARRLTWGRNPPLDFAGQKWLITGASLGLGKAMMKAAAEAGAEVIAVARNEERLESARQELSAAARERVSIKAADLSLISGTQQLLDALLASGEKLDVLMNNVGLLLNDLVLTPEGRETSYVTNVLSHFQLTEGLLHNEGLNDDAVIVNMTSGGMYHAPLGYSNLNVTDPAKYNGKAAYAYAKRAQVALTGYWDLAGRDRGIRCYVTHPGWSKTPGVQTALPVFWKLQYFILRTPLQGADTALWLSATRPAKADAEGVWFDRDLRPAHMYDFTRKAQCTVEELVAYLQQDLGPEKDPEANAVPAQSGPAGQSFSDS